MFEEAYMLDGSEAARTMLHQQESCCNRSAVGCDGCCKKLIHAADRWMQRLLQRMLLLHPRPVVSGGAHWHVGKHISQPVTAVSRYEAFGAASTPARTKSPSVLQQHVGFYLRVFLIHRV